MQFYGKAETVANRIVSEFQSGNLPRALAPIFIQRNDDIPCRQWSWLNQLAVALAGHDDARGFRQWKEVGRAVRKGERCTYILVPLIGKRKLTDRDTGEEVERKVLYGFKSAAVFGYGQTDGEPIERDTDAERFIDALPFVEVARHWGLSVRSYNGRANGPLGKYRRGESIAVGVENLATWAHELMHAADDRLGNLKECGQHWRSETVAEFGAAVLLSMTGRESDADLGGAWRYISTYCERERKSPAQVCMQVLNRVCDAVAFILTTADEVAVSPATSATTPAVAESLQVA